MKRDDSGSGAEAFQGCKNEKAMDVLSRMVKKEKHWYCLDCGKEFMPRNKNCAFRHIDLNHMSKYKFICEYCDKSFTAKNNLMYHHRNCQVKQNQQQQQKMLNNIN